MKAVLYENISKSGTPKEYPIYEIKKTITPNSTTNQSPSGMPKCLCFYWAGADLKSLFPDWDIMPHLSTEYGSLIRTKSQYELDTDNIRRVLDSEYVPVQIGTKPDDWDENWMYYGTVFNTYSGAYGGSYAIYSPNVMSYNDTYPTKTWDSNTQYYHNNPADTDYRLSRIFCTKNNGVYGISACTLQNYAMGYWGILSRRGGLAPFYVESDGTFVSFPYAAEMWTGSGDPPTEYYLMTGSSVGAGCVLGYMNTNDIDYGGILTYHNQMFIIVHYVDTENNDEDYYGFALLNMDNANNDLTIVRCVLFDTDFWGESIQPDEPQPQPSNFGPDSAPEGGDGTFTAPSNSRVGTDVFDTSTLLTPMSQRISAANTVYSAGFNIYNLGKASAFNSVTINSVIQTFFGTDFFDKFKNSMYNPLSCVLSYHLMPSNLIGANSSTAKHLTAGGFDISAEIVNTPTFYTVPALQKYHVGSVDIGKYFGAFPDFAPYTKMILHLPYIGECELDTNAVMYGSVDIWYLTDSVSGNCAAWIFCKDRNDVQTAKYVVTGNAAFTIPLFSQSQNGAAVGKIASGILQLAMGDIRGAVNAGIGAAEMSTTPRNTSSTGGVSGNASMISDSVCWLEIIRAQWVNPEYFKNLHGIACMISGTLSDFTGFVQVQDIDLIDIPCTDAERAEIESLMRDGILHNPAATE